MPSRRTARRPITDALRRAIVACGLRQHELAQLAGIDRASLSRFLARERSLSSRTVDALAAALGLALRPITDDALPETSAGSDPAEDLERGAELPGAVSPAIEDPLAGDIDGPEVQGGDCLS